MCYHDEKLDFFVKGKEKRLKHVNKNALQKCDLGWELLMFCRRECESIFIEYGDYKIKNAPFCRLLNKFTYFRYLY